MGDGVLRSTCNWEHGGRSSWLLKNRYVNAFGVQDNAKRRTAMVGRVLVMVMAGERAKLGPIMLS
jgi:hypothetical protein